MSGGANLAGDPASAWRRRAAAVEARSIGLALTADSETVEGGWRETERARPTGAFANKTRRIRTTWKMLSKMKRASGQDQVQNTEEGQTGGDVTNMKGRMKWNVSGDECWLAVEAGVINASIAVRTVACQVEETVKRPAMYTVI